MASDETRDPREAVLVDIIIEEGNGTGTGTPTELLARLDAADPIRTLWPEVVEALEWCETNFRIFHDATGADEEWDPSVRPTFEVWKNARDLLTRIREIEGGKHG